MNVNVSLCGGDGMKLDDMVGMRSGDGDLMRGMEWGFKQWWWDGNKVMEMACRWGTKLFTTSFSTEALTNWLSSVIKGRQT